MPEPAPHAEILDALSGGVGLVDAAGTLTYANRALATLFDAAPGDLPGRPVADALGGLGREIDWVHAAKNAVERGRSLQLARQPIGNGVHVDCVLSPFPAARGALLTVNDVTETVGGEASLLRQAKSQAIANLGDSVAHEIRNPLNSIHMNVQLLREGLARDEPDHDETDRIAANVQREIKRLDRVVRDFVQYSRPPALALEAGSVNHVLRAALDLLDAQIQKKDLKVELDLQSARPVPLDRDRIQRVFYNVLLNAVHVLPRGGTIQCRSRDGKRHCTLEIADDGPGFDPGQTAHVFEIFYTTKPGGTGLGLPIANRIVEEHGGRMALASEPGRGATFAIFLPFDGPPSTRGSGPTAVPRMPEETGSE